jgi:hypothetical protein
MFSTPRRVAVSVFTLVLLLVVALPGVAPVKVPGTVVSADPEVPRSYVEFIEGAYLGALGRLPNCFEAQEEYDALVSAAGGGVLQQEAQRFVSTLFETQASYNVNDGTTYCQTVEYEAINPASCNTAVGVGTDSFLADLYRAFLLREPDATGFNYWLNNNGGRKHLINAFRGSLEFATLVDHLFAGTRPVCQIECPECNPEPCEGPNQNGHYSKLCP